MTRPARGAAPGRSLDHLAVEGGVADDARAGAVDRDIDAAHQRLAARREPDRRAEAEHALGVEAKAALPEGRDRGHRAELDRRVLDSVPEAVERRPLQAHDLAHPEERAVWEELHREGRRQRGPHLEQRAHELGRALDRARHRVLARALDHGAQPEEVHGLAEGRREELKRRVGHEVAEHIIGGARGLHRLSAVTIDASSSVPIV